MVQAFRSKTWVCRYSLCQQAQENKFPGKDKRTQRLEDYRKKLNKILKPKSNPVGSQPYKFISRTRGKVERVFGTFKRTYGFKRSRYIGLAKVEAILKSIAFNLKKAVTLMQKAQAAS